MARLTTTAIISRTTRDSGASGLVVVVWYSCIDARSANAAAFVIPVENAVKIWNQLKPTVQNIDLDSSNGLASHQVDFESVFLHELGHCLGLGHPNAAT